MPVTPPTPDIRRSPRTAKKWTCDRCGVSAGQINGGRCGLPAGWESSGKAQLCLACRRQRAGEAAMDAASEHRSNAEGAQLRRAAVVEFEIRRLPGRSNRQIANVCRTSVQAVARSRKKLGTPAPSVLVDNNLQAPGRPSSP